MSEIGLRSGKIRAGLYRVGQYTIERKQSDYWVIYKYYGTDVELHISQWRTLTEAYYESRYVLK